MSNEGLFGATANVVECSVKFRSHKRSGFQFKHEK